MLYCPRLPRIAGDSKKYTTIGIDGPQSIGLKRLDCIILVRVYSSNPINPSLCKEEALDEHCFVKSKTMKDSMV